ncbi:SRPBCC domain-containing protein [Leifsonia sp. NPDC058292]|uniref:SRPBCC family protein n=1 Tax=Leifsonia sp. NPDC058292 TaxID=3346428 RepID=UPI0036DD844D
MTQTTGTERGFTLTRILDAPRDLVFQAWTDPAHLGWFFAEGTPADEPVEVDLRVGGAWRQRMIESDTKQYVTGGIYREIVPGERIVFEFGAVGGWPEIRPDRPDEVPVVTVQLDDLGDKTELTLRVELPERLSDAEAQAWLDLGIREGWGITIDRLVARFATDSR